MASSWQFVGVEEETADIQVQDSNGDLLAGVRYNGDFNQPAVLQAYLPASNMFMLTSLANRDYDVIGDGSYTLGAAALLQTSDNQVHNQYSVEGFIIDSTFLTWLGSPGDGTSNLYPSSENGVSREWVAGGAGSVGDADGGGFRWKVGNNNGNVDSFQGKWEYLDGNNNIIWTLFQKTYNGGHALGAAVEEINILYHDGTGSYGGSMLGTNVDGNKLITLGGLNAGDLIDFYIGVNQIPVLRAGTVVDETTTIIDLYSDGAIYDITTQTVIANITVGGSAPPTNAEIKIRNVTGVEMTIQQSSDIQCPNSTDLSVADFNVVTLLFDGTKWVVTNFI